MRTLRFSDVLSEASELCGYDSDNIPESFFRMARKFANMRLRIAWNGERWTSVVRYLSVSPVTVGGIIKVDYPADAGDILNVWDSDPRKTNAEAVPYFLADDGDTRQIVLATAEDPVVVEYRIGIPRLSGNAWQSGQSYSVGDQVYYETSTGVGDFYTANAATSAGQSPQNTGEKWDLVEIPLIFGQYLSRGIYADFLRSNGEIQNAQIADGDADAMLRLEADNLFRQQGQVRRLQVEMYR